MEIELNNEYDCLCNNKYSKIAFKKHYKKCLFIQKRFSELDNKISFF